MTSPPEDSWQRLQREAPDFAQRVRDRFDAGTNKTLATLRADGSPRISGTELSFADGRITLGMMPHSRKLADVLRDPRVAIHCPPWNPQRGHRRAGPVTPRSPVGWSPSLTLPMSLPARRVSRSS